MSVVKDVPLTWKDDPYEKILGELEDFQLYKFPGRNPHGILVMGLLHGNETSGFYGIINTIKEWLRRGVHPWCDVYFLIGNSTAARMPPHFSNRINSNGLDYNRIWALTKGDKELRGKVQNVFDFVKAKGIRFAIDLHNTSGKNPPFLFYFNDNHTHFAKQFGQRLVFGGNYSTSSGFALERLGVSIVSLECGLTRTADAHARAQEHIQTCISYLENDGNLSVKYPQPIFLEIMAPIKFIPGIEFVFGAGPSEGVVIREDIEELNFKLLPAGSVLGYAKEMPFQLIGMDGESILDDWLCLEEGAVKTKQDCILMLASRDKRIVKQDCLAVLGRYK